MNEFFELDWFGGPVERYIRKRRPGIDKAFPWGTLKPASFDPDIVDRARQSWTEGAFNEYCTGASFAVLLAAMLQAKAPIDLVAMAGDFIGDEMLHVELNSRVAMELGGGVPLKADFSEISVPADPSLPAFERANEIVVRLCCVGEALSVPVLSGCAKTAGHPLTREVLRRIAKDERPHGQFGWFYLEWAGERMSETERQRLAGIAASSLESYRGYVDRLPESPLCDTEVAEILALGWMEPAAMQALLPEAVKERVVMPLAKWGIEVAVPDALA